MQIEVPVKKCYTQETYKRAILDMSRCRGNKWPAEESNKQRDLDKLQKVTCSFG